MNNEAQTQQSDMKTINNKLIRTLKPCFNPLMYVKDENETLSVLEWVLKYRGTVPDADIIWLLCHKDFLSDKQLRLFGIWCAREALELVDNPDPRCIEACNVSELYANKEATKEELEFARDAAADAREAAVNAFARDTAAVNSTYAAVAAAYVNDVDVAYYAAAAAAAAGAAADAAADRVVARAAQLNKLLTYFK